MNIEQQLDTLSQRVEQALQLAKTLGATQAEASISKDHGITVSTRLKEVETLEYTDDGALGITVYCGQRKGSASTADLSDEALRQTVEKAVNIARYTSEDSCAGLADKAMLETAPKDLKLYFDDPLDPGQAIELAIAAETAALDADSRIVNSDGASYTGNQGLKVYGNTHGFIAGFPSSRYSMSCVVIGQDGEDMQRDYSYTLARDPRQLASAQQVGEEAAKFTLERLNPRSVKTGKYPVIFHSSIAAGVFGHLVSAISGGSLYRKSSFLLDHCGKQILPTWCNISERPHVISGLASSPFDAEGVRTQDADIITDGVLTQYLMTSYSARKLGLQTTGHAGGIHNWFVQDSGLSLQAMLKEMGTGLLVTELMGQGVNIVNGDYSRGAAGFWVEDGQIQYPVAEITIASNLKQMFAQLQAVGDDVDTRSSILTGSLWVDSMQVAGN